MAKRKSPSLIEEIDNIVIRFAGDSGDGIQVMGTQFSQSSAFMGNDISTFPNFPSEIRAPEGTIAGVSGYQVQVGSNEVITAGDNLDVLIAMNPAALKANIKDLKQGGAAIINVDAFTERNLKKAKYEENPLENDDLVDYKIISAHITTQTLDSVKDIDITQKEKLRCKNFYALGLASFIYGRSLDPIVDWIEKKFANKKEYVEANTLVLKAGYHFGETIETGLTTYKIHKAKLKPGTYRQINGNTALSWGLVQAAHAAGLDLFLGSYPITPATDILHELSKIKNFGVKTFQAEDEIAGICSAIGASFGGALGITTTSGPGLALKTEALGLAMMYELPLVVVNVQRGGPSTGLPTKTEQSDLEMALYGRSGDSPVIVLAASRPADCFHMAYEAARLTLEHMTPVILLTDNYIANGAEPWRLPDLKKDYKKIKTFNLSKDKFVKMPFMPFKRDKKTLARNWAIPGMTGCEHRLGSLEKAADETGNVSYEPEDHQKMVRLRQEKVDRVQNNIPEQKLYGDKKGDLLVISWGGTFGANYQAVKQLSTKGEKVSHVHLKYICPFPKNLANIITNFKKILVPELNNGQMVNVIRSTFERECSQYNKTMGIPFTVGELVDAMEKALKK